MMIEAHEEPQPQPHHRQERKKTPKPQPNQLLRQAREQRCWSQAELAELIEVMNGETISRWENGVNKPQPRQLKKLCEVFGKTPAELGYPPRPAPIKIEENGAAPNAPVEIRAIKQGTPPPHWRQSRAIIGGISGLIIILLVLGVIRFVPPLLLPKGCGETFFNGNLGSGWAWINPGEKASYHLTPTSLTLSAPTKSNLNPLYNFNAPRLLRPITGNFTIETQLVFHPDTNFQSAGILLWQDSSTFLRFERGFGGKNSGVFLQAWDHGPTPMTITPLGKYPTTAESVELRIQRQGDAITASWHELGQSWQPGGDTVLHFDRLFIGVDLIDDFNRLQTTSASYSSFSVTCS
jgi:transcriptional regulator with XRE-family HTH domain/regulation of enolase protein 1 (concanavalin A-like superfamily)